MTPEEENEKHNKKLCWIWAAIFLLLFTFAIKDACRARAENPELEANAYFLSCDSE